MNLPITGGVLSATDGTRLSYLSLGSGPTLVCLHGGLATGTDWMPTAHLLAERYRVVTYDRRGAGASDAGRSGHSLAHELDDLRTVLEHTGGAHALLAHSFGALIALNAAALTDLPVQALVMYEPPVMIDGSRAARHLGIARRSLAAGGAEAVLLDALQNMLQLPPATIATMRADPRGWATLVATAPTLLAQAEMSVELAGRYRHYASITQPALLLLGELGDGQGIFRRTQTALREVIPHLTTASLSGQGHAAMVRAPRLLADSIAAYLSRSDDNVSSGPAPRLSSR